MPSLHTSCSNCCMAAISLFRTLSAGCVAPWSSVEKYSWLRRCACSLTQTRTTSLLLLLLLLLTLLPTSLSYGAEISMYDIHTKTKRHINVINTIHKFWLSWFFLPICSIWIMTNFQHVPLFFIFVFINKNYTQFKIMTHAIIDSITTKYIKYME